MSETPMFHLAGGCHCGNVRVSLELSKTPGSYAPRVCDCAFCRKHGAAYLSDPQGRLRIHVEHAGRLGRYRQGSGTAEFLVCQTCGVLAGVIYQEGERLYASVNTPALEGDVRLGERRSVSPRTLAADEKVRRWKELWFPDVSLVSHGP